MGSGEGRKQEHRLVLAHKAVHLADGICRPLIRTRYAERISSLCEDEMVGGEDGQGWYLYERMNCRFLSKFRVLV